MHSIMHNFFLSHRQTTITFLTTGLFLSAIGYISADEANYDVSTNQSEPNQVDMNSPRDSADDEAEFTPPPLLIDVPVAIEAATESATEMANEMATKAGTEPAQTYPAPSNQPEQPTPYNPNAPVQPSQTRHDNDNDDTDTLAASSLKISNQLSNTDEINIPEPTILQASEFQYRYSEASPASQTAPVSINDEQGVPDDLYAPEHDPDDSTATTTSFIQPSNEGSLLMLFNNAISSDPTYRAAFARGEADSEAYVIDRAFLLPRIDLSAEYTEHEDEIVNNPFGGGGTNEDYSSDAVTLQVSQAIFRWDMLALLRRGEALTQAARVRQLDAQQQLVNRLINAYLDVQLSRTSVELAETNLRGIAEQLEDNRNRYEVGSIAITGLKEAQSRYDIAQADLIDSEQALLNSRLRLKQITGLPAPKAAPTTPSFRPQLPYPADLEAWSQQAIFNNLNVGLAALNEIIATENVAFARNDHFPTLDFVGVYTERESGSAFGSETENQQLGLRFNLPLFRGGATLANVRAANQNRAAASADLDLARRQATIQTQTAYYAVESAVARVSALDQATESAAATLTAIQDGAEFGTRTTAEVLDARTTLISTQQRLIAARYDYLRAVADLQRSIGQLNATVLAWMDTVLNNNSRRPVLQLLNQAAENPILVAPDYQQVKPYQQAE